MFMGVVLLALWSMSILLIMKDRKVPSSRWASLTAFIGGFGFLAGIIDDELRPVLQDFINPSFDVMLHYAANTASLICQMGMPYAFLLFALHSWPAINEQTRKWVAGIAMLPIIYSLVTTPVVPELLINYRITNIWVVPYLLFSSLLLLYLYFREKDPLLRRGRYVVLMIGVAPILFITLTIYIFRLYGWYEAWRYNALLIFAQFLLFVGFALKHGVLGVKLSVEQNRLNMTLRALTSGTSILNHSIKNEVGKMQLILHRLNRLTEDQPEIREDIRDLQQSTEHMLNMVQRIQGKVQEIPLKESACPMDELLNQAIDHVHPYLQQKQIELVQVSKPRWTLWVDPVQLKEVWINLLMNAIEAVPVGGKLEIESYVSKKYFVFVLKDNGKGIPREQLAHVFEPFFSTKKHSESHFGLGLAYCYQVLRKHQGLMEMDSTVGSGTRVYLYIPRKRQMNVSEIEQKEGTQECDKSRS